MALKLLTPSQNETSKQHQRDQSIAQGAKIAEEVDKVRGKLVSAKDIYDKQNQRYKDDLDSYVDFMNRKKQAIEDEMKVLEQKRIALLKPVDEELAKVKLLKAKAKDQFEEYQKQLSINREVEEKLMDRLGETDVKLSEAENREEEACRKLISLKDREAMMQKSAQDLSTRWTEYNEAIEKENSRFRDLQMEYQIIAKENATKAEINERDRVELSLQKSRLDSRQEALIVAAQELKDKYGEKYRA